MAVSVLFKEKPMPNTNKKGIVYIAKNPSFKEECIKIGITKNLKQRLKDLSGSNVPYPYTCLYACEVKDCKEVEKAIHKICINSRIKKEFFKTDPKPIIQLLKQLSLKEITKDIDDAIEREADKEQSKAKVVTKKTDIPKGYKTYKELKKFLTAKPGFRDGFFCIRLSATHKWKKVPYYKYGDEPYYSEEVFRIQAKNEGVLAK